MSSGGVDVRHVRSHTFLPWSDIQEVRTIDDWNFGSRIVVVDRTGHPVTLPAPTSKTGRFNEGLNRIRTEITQHR